MASGQKRVGELLMALSVEVTGLRVAARRSAEIAYELSAPTPSRGSAGSEPSCAGIDAFDEALVEVCARRSAQVHRYAGGLERGAEAYERTDADTTEHLNNSV